VSDPFVDTNVFVRFITGDDPVKQAAAQALFRRMEAGSITLRAPDTVIADAVFVLCSARLYNPPRPRVRTELATLLRCPHLKVHNRRILLRALDIFAGYPRLDFGDAMILAAMERRGSTDVYSYDHDFEGAPSIQRRDP
jgi:predicted nucleic acid-binding protein